MNIFEELQQLKKQFQENISETEQINIIMKPYKNRHTELWKEKQELERSINKKKLTIFNTIETKDGTCGCRFGHICSNTEYLIKCSKCNKKICSHCGQFGECQSCYSDYKHFREYTGFTLNHFLASWNNLDDELPEPDDKEPTLQDHSYYETQEKLEESWFYKKWLEDIELRKQFRILFKTIIQSFLRETFQNEFQLTLSDPLEYQIKWPCEDCDIDIKRCPGWKYYLTKGQLYEAYEDEILDAVHDEASERYESESAQERWVDKWLDTASDKKALKLLGEDFFNEIGPKCQYYDICPLCPK